MIADTYWVIMSAVSTPGCSSRCSNAVLRLAMRLVLRLTLPRHALRSCSAASESGKSTRMSNSSLILEKRTNWNTHDSVQSSIVHTRTHARTHHTRTHARAHTHTHTHTHTHAHTHTHTHAYAQLLVCTSVLRNSCRWGTQREASSTSCPLPLLQENTSTHSISH